VMDAADRDGDGNGDNPTRLTNNAAVDANPSFSPEGTKIAFETLRDGNEEIYVMNAADRDGDGNGDNPTRLTNNAVTDQNPSCSPDGTKIALETLRGSNKEIYMMDAADQDGDGNGDNPTRLTNNAATDRYPDWGPLADVSPPRVTSTIPNATGVAPTTNVKATFSEAMDASTTDGDPSTITATTFMLFSNGSTTQVAARVSYDSSTRTAKLNPNNNLRRGVTYRAVLTTGVQDLAGNPLAQQKEWLFTVKR
jgi:dipeptidyl aminopeptidase/acylaminoacyl peptidase